MVWHLLAKTDRADYSTYLELDYDIDTRSQQKAFESAMQIPHLRTVLGRTTTTCFHSNRGAKLQSWTLYRRSATFHANIKQAQSNAERKEYNKVVQQNLNFSVCRLLVGQGFLSHSN